MCRYDPDPAPCAPLPGDAWTTAPAVTDDALAQQVGRLRAALNDIR